MLIANSERFKEMEYDLLFEAAIKGYKLFEESQFNKPKLPAYECMEEFLKSNITIPFALIQDRVGREEDIFFITGLEHCVDQLKDINPRRTFEIPALFVIEFEIYE